MENTRSFITYVNRFFKIPPIIHLTSKPYLTDLKYLKKRELLNLFALK